MEKERFGFHDPLITIGYGIQNVTQTNSIKYLKIS